MQRFEGASREEDWRVFRQEKEEGMATIIISKRWI